jgi:hypothetical protein
MSMKQLLLAGLGVFFLTTPSAEAQAPTIDHQPVGCAAAEKFPRLVARFAPADGIASARVMFQGANNQEWYFVAMKPEGAMHFGVLPKPRKSLKAFRYYIEVTDKALGTNRTPEYTANVVDSSSACKGKIMAGTLASASVVIQGPAGLAAVPAGFASTGVVAGSATGSSAGAAGAATAGGGGLSTGAVVGIVAGVGAAAAGVAVKTLGSSFHIQLEGTVYRGVCSCFEVPGSPRLGARISGALVSTSLDANTATTDGNGHFLLVTTGEKGTTYTHTISAAGCQPFSITGQADDSTGPNAQTYSLNCN